MDILNSLYTSVFGMAVVFVVLVCLILLINLQTFLIRRFSTRRAATDMAIAIDIPAQLNADHVLAAKEIHFTSSAPQFVDLIDVDEKTAAIIMAIMCEQIGALPEELYFKSIRLLTDPVPAKN